MYINIICSFCYGFSVFFMSGPLLINSNSLLLSTCKPTRTCLQIALERFFLQQKAITNKTRCFNMTIPSDHIHLKYEHGH